MLNDLSKSYTLLLGIAVILLTGLAFSKLAKKIHVPDVTGYLLGGLLIGPALFQFIIPNFPGIIGHDFIKGLEIIASIELGFIAFSVGSEFKFSYFKQVGAMPIIIAFAESFAAVIFIIVGMLLIQVPLPFALCIGAVGGATAPAATVMVIKQYKATGDLAKTTLSVVAIDDASALIFFGFCIAIVRSMLLPTANITLTLLMPFIEILGSLLIGILFGVILTFLIRFFKGKGTRICLAMAMIFLNIAIANLIKEEVNFGSESNPIHVGLSSLLMCMGMGAIFTNFSPAVDETMELIDRITPPFVIVFFVLSGADLRLESLGLIALLVTAIYLIFRVAGKVVGTAISAKACKASPKIQKYLGWGLLPQGGIAIGLSLIVMQELPVSFHDTYNGQLIRIVVICAVFVSEIFGPILLKRALFKAKEADPHADHVD